MKRKYDEERGVVKWKTKLETRKSRSKVFLERLCQTVMIVS